MANDFIDIKEDASPTKKLASQSFSRTGPGTVHQEEVAIGDGANDGRIVTVTAANALKVDGSAVTQPVSDGGGALTVDALDLDIRNLTTSDEVKVSGQAADGAAVAGNPVRIAGKDGSGNTQDLATNTSGELQVGVTASPKASSVTAHAQTSVGTTAVALLSANAARKRFIVQNTGTTVIKLGFTATDPTQTSYHVALAACSAADAGDGGTFIDELWTGVVEAISSSASGSVVVTEMT